MTRASAARSSSGLRERKKTRTRIAIQSHAFRLFREKGYAATTMEQIAEAADVSPSTLFRYFPTKKDLVLGGGYFEPVILDALSAQPATLDPLRAIRSTFRAFFDNLSADERANMRQARFLSQGQVAQVAQFAGIPLEISDFPTRHNYGLALWQRHIERILAGWVGELVVPIYRGREVTGFAQDDTGVDVEFHDGADGQSLRAEYLVGCDGGRSLIRKAAGIDFPGWDPTTSNLIAEVEMAEEPEWGIRYDAFGVNSLSRPG